jgi:hypothetical protein
MRRSLSLHVLASLAAAVLALASVASSSGGSPIDGRWTWTWTEAEMAHAAAPRATGSFLAEFRDGGMYGNYPTPGSPVVFVGTFAVHGDLVSLRFLRKGSGATTGRTYVMRFSIFRDRLTWSMVRGRAGLDHLPFSPWTRVG